MMRTRWPLTAIRFALVQIPTLLVFAVLGGLFYWGHHYHWKIPAFADLAGHGALMEGGSAAETPTEVIRLGSDGDAGDNPAVLYRIRLRSPEAAGKAGIRTEPVRERPLAHRIAANAVLDYDQTKYAELASRAPGTVWSVEKTVGDRVKKGEVLALVAAPELGRLKAEFLEAFVNVGVKQNVVDRIEAAGNSIPARALADARLALRQARTRLANAQQALLNLHLPLRLRDLDGLREEQVMRRLRVLGLPPALARTMDPETLSANLLPLTAPFDGQVVERDMVVGEVVGTDKPLFVVADVRRLWIRLNVRLEDARGLAVGQKVTFDSGHAGDEVAAGELDWISPGVDKRTRTVSARATVDNAGGYLRPDTFGTARVLVRESPRALAVPSRAVQHDGGVPLVFVRLSDGSFEARTLRTGIRDDEFTEVTAGLALGDEVVTDGSFLLKSAIVRSRLEAGE